MSDAAPVSVVTGAGSGIGEATVRLLVSEGQRVNRGDLIGLVGSSATVRLGLDSLIKGGKLIIVGLYGGDITVSLPPFPMRAITVQGSYTGSLNDMAEMLDLVRRKGLPPIPVATRPLADVNAALADLRAGKVVGRVVLTPS